jgi:deoxyribodipyrimidine photolyase-related protein
VVETVWVLGDQLNREMGALNLAAPDSTRVLMVESGAKVASKPGHRQRAHLVICAMRRFAAELALEGFEVDYRRESSLAAGLHAHVAQYQPSRVVATEPASFDGVGLLDLLGVDTVRTNQFLCHYDEFAEWASDRRSVKMEDFYRWQRRRLEYLMDGTVPAGGQWNFDADNRERPPKDGRQWPEPIGR